MLEKRVSILYGILVLSLSVLLARLYNLAAPETNRSMAVLDGQYTGRIQVVQRSGFVYDRNMNLLSHDKTGKVALVNPAVCTDANKYAEILSEKAAVSTKSDIYKKIDDGIPFTVALSAADTAEVQALDGVYVYDTYAENTDTAVHFLGYNNSDGDGVCGIRGEYSALLGETLEKNVSAVFETNAKNMSMSPFVMEDDGYKSADGIVTTIDKGLQKYCDGLENEITSGSVVVSDVRTGEILALSSFPTYDISELESLLDSDRGELVNRTVMSFTPGSVFKMLVAAAAIETNYNLWELEYECDGKIEIDGSVFRCHNRNGHGRQTMPQAFANSCNTYFINLGMRTGLDTIVKISKRFELDKAVNADFLKESKNCFPDENNKAAGYLAGISFGQADLCLSPLDMIRIVTGVSTGYLVPLSVIRGQVTNGEINIKKHDESVRILRRSTCEKMLMMMEKCVNEGTGSAALTHEVKVGGKTATAQTGRYDGKGVEYVHKWFCGVYPIENPAYSVCILCDFSTENAVSPSVIFSDICLYLKENGF